MPSPAQYPTISDKGVVGIILEQLEASLAGSWVSLIANQYSSNQATETYAGIGNVPALREWLGEKQLKSLNIGSLTITNKDWESTLRLMRKDLQRDKTGFLRQRAGELATRAAEHDEKLLSELIDTGDDADIGTAFDGQFFFDTDHSFGASGTINNDITVDISALATGQHGSVTAPSVGEAAMSILAGIQQIYGFKDDQAEPINGSARNFIAMVPVPLWAAFSGAVDLDAVASGEQNPLRANQRISVAVIVNPRLTWTDEFAIFRTDGNAKALAVQTEMGPMVEVLGDGSDYAFHNAAHLYSVIKSGNVGYQRFDQACLVTMI